MSDIIGKIKQLTGKHVKSMAETESLVLEAFIRTALQFESSGYEAKDFVLVKQQTMKENVIEIRWWIEHKTHE